MATWLSGVKRQSWGRDGGSFTTSPDKILLHSTETGSFPGYGGGASAPHFTIDLENGEVRQHSPMNRAARALRNYSGGVQTNRDGVIQIEIIGTCDASFSRKYGYPYIPDMSDAMASRLKWLLEKIHNATGIPLKTSVTWKEYPSSYGNSSVRMSNSEWSRYKGILGHQHAPENTHGDPGDLPMKRILGADAVKGGSSSGGGSDYTVVGPDAPLGLYDKDGDGRTRVKDWQTDALGYDEKKADGYFGPDTEDDTKDLQKQIGVKADGLVGEDTVAAWEKSGKPKLGKSTKPKPEPSKPSKPKVDKLTVDGKWGESTTRRVQEELGTPVDGQVSYQPIAYKSENPGLLSGWEWTKNPRSSNVMEALQRKLGVDDDGRIGPNTIKALQRKLGTGVDGKVSNPSAMVKQLQRNLNAGKLW